MNRILAKQSSPNKMKYNPEPLVSAIITTHNRCELLQRAIESVLRQSYKNIECIVVDDASEDNTKGICEKYNVRYVYIPKNESHGGNYARNLGIKAAKGEYCAFLDDDDYWLDTKIEKQYELAIKKKSDLVYCHKIHEYVSNGRIMKSVPINDPTPEGNLKSKIFCHYITNTSCLFASKKALFKVGLFDENLLKWQEYDLMIRMAAMTDIYCVNECLCVYTVNRSDANRISNDANRVAVTVDYFRDKYKTAIDDLSLKDRVCFEQMCACALYSSTRKGGKRLLTVKSFMLHTFFSTLKAILFPVSFVKSMVSAIRRRLF